MLDTRMETFLTVCRTMNFTRAAELLNMTQPAVSQQIHFLEDWYGTPLFLRERKRLTLTPAGEVLRQSMESLRNDDRAVRRRMAESMAARNTLTFGVTRTVGEYAIVPSLARLIQRHPDTDFHIRYGNTETLLAALHSGDIDFAIVEGYFQAAQYHTLLYRREAYIAVASAQHVFARPVRRLRDLTGERLLVREPGSGTRAVLTRALAVQNLSIHDFERLAEVEDIHTIVSLLQQDCGISFLYRAAVERELRSGELKEIQLEDFSVSHDFTALWHRDSIFTGEYSAIIEELR